MKINFDNYKGENIKIGVIDSGISNKVVNNAINAHKNYYHDFNDYIGHGTKVSKIIGNLVPLSKLYNIKVFDKTYQTSSQSIINAIEWGIENKLHVLNLSLGTKDFSYYNKYKSIIKKAETENCFIVTAISNDYAFSLPAVLQNVISVGSSCKNIEEPYGYYFVKNEFLQFVADGGKFVNCFFDCIINRWQYTSYAAPIITSVVAIILEVCGSIKFHQLMEVLKYNSLSDDPCAYFISRKLECKSLINCLNSNIIEKNPISSSRKICYLGEDDIEYFINTYKDLLNVEIDIMNFNAVIKFNLESMDDNQYRNKILWDSQIDFFIISESILSYNTEIKSKVIRLLKEILNNNFKIYSFVSQKIISLFVEDDSITQNKNISYMTNYMNKFKNNSLDFYKVSEKPIICIIDLTENEFNSFEIQLLLRRYLLNQQLNFSQISTTVFAELFGIDLVLHEGLVINDLSVAELISFISYINYHFLISNKSEMLIYNFSSSPFLSLNNNNEMLKNKNSIVTMLCLRTILPDAYILIISKNIELNTIINNIDNIIVGYNPDLIVLLECSSNIELINNANINTFDNNFEIRLNEQLINKFGTANNEIHYLRYSKDKWEQSIYELIIKHYKA